MSGTITTLYINDESIRLMVTHGKRISKIADVPLDINIAEVSAEDKQAELADKIRHLFEINKISTRRVIIGISGLHCLSRPAVLPLLPKAMQDEAMTREAKRLLPVPPEQLHISWQIASVTDNKMQAFIVAIPRQIADTLLKVLDQVGLKPYMMDIKPLALARLSKEPTSIIVDVQPKEFDIVIMVEGVPQPMRSVAFPNEKLSSTDRIMIVKDELNRTIQFFNSNNPEKKLDSSVTMFVSGELADDPAVYESLAAELGFQVLPLTSPLKCPKQLDPTHYLVNVGLTLKELPKEAGALLANINTLPVSYQPKAIPMNRLMALPAAAAAIGVVILLAMTIQSAVGNIDDANEQLNNTNFLLQKKQAEKEELVKVIENNEKKLASMQKTRNNFIAARDTIDTWGDRINGDLNATVYNIIDEFTPTIITHTGDQLSINGQVPTEVEALEYGRNLRNTGRFTEVTISNLRRIAASDNETTRMEYSYTLRPQGFR